MKEFILSLVSPLKIKKYRYMSVFISMLIFVVSIYFISIPNKIYMNNHKEEYLSQKVFVNAYTELPETQLGTDFISNKYKINEEYKMVSSSASETFQTYIYEDIKVKINNEEQDINLYIVFDLNEVINKTLNLFNEEYKKLYPDDSVNKSTAAVYLSLAEWMKLDSESANDEWKTNKFNELHAIEEEELLKAQKKLTNFDLFNISIDEKDNNYLLMFFPEYCVSQIKEINKVKKDDVEVEEITYPTLTVVYQSHKIKFDFTEQTNLKEFGREFVDGMFKPLSDSDQTNYLLQVVGYVLIFPAIFVLLLCWTMKKHGVLKTYKEYYNVASICSILPLIISFVLSWFVPNIAVLLYGGLFCLYTLFTFIKINSTPELVD